MTKIEIPEAEILNAANLTGLTSEIPSRCNRLIDPADIMFDGNTEDYVDVGVSALNSIVSLLKVLNRPSPENILDFGCGHGRVMRWIRSAYPQAKITGTDVGENGVRFCAKNFGAVPVVSGLDLAQLEPFHGQDLIWSGSVFTHLRESDSRQLMLNFIEWLAPGGCAIFSTHGQAASRNMEWEVMDYTQGQGHEDLLKNYRETGYGFTSYKGTPDYGISLINKEWYWGEIGGRANLRICYLEQAWVYHHDLVVIQKF